MIQNNPSPSASLKQVISNYWPFLAEATFEPTAQGSSQATYFVYTPLSNFFTDATGGFSNPPRPRYRR